MRHNEHLDWQDCIARYDRPSTLFYLDPPYWGTAGYGRDFGLEQYSLLAETMAALQGRAILSVNDCPEMRLAFGAFRPRTAAITYTVGGPRRSRSATRELIVRSWVRRPQ